MVYYNKTVSHIVVDPKISTTPIQPQSGTSEILIQNLTTDFFLKPTSISSIGNIFDNTGQTVGYNYAQGANFNNNPLSFTGTSVSTSGLLYEYLDPSYIGIQGFSNMPVATGIYSTIYFTLQ